MSSLISNNILSFLFLRIFSSSNISLTSKFLTPATVAIAYPNVFENGPFHPGKMIKQTYNKQKINNHGIQLEFYNDGSVEKKYIIVD